MGKFKQGGRTLTITTPLGKDVLILVGFQGREEMSQPFEFNLDLISENLSIAPNDIVGKPVTWVVYPDGPTPRYFNGIVSRFGAGPANSRGYRTYRANVVPWPWFLGLSEDCRIFQEKTALDIIKSWFEELGFSDFDDSGVSPAPAKRVYCVQYRETTLAFVSRLMEQEGIYYFVRHHDGKHNLVMSSQKSSYWDIDDEPGEAIISWQHHHEFRAGKWTFTDYNFETPATSLLSTTNTILTIPGMDKFERFEYPGHYQVTAHGDAWAKIRMEEEEASHDVVHGESEFMFFAPGGKFTAPEGESEKFVITSVEHRARDESTGGGGGKGGYSNNFTCIPASVLYRPARLTPWPRVYGPQTAVVTGPKGEEQLVDKYGRIKVQFFWDRKGKKDDKSSCWIRVAQPISGKGWGAQYIPRMGQEVVVDFLEGDPDRPLVTGAVYNAQNMPPYALPDHMTKSGYLGRSTKDGEAVSNELWIEDKKDSEDIYFYAKKDFHRKVQHDDDLKVLNCQTISIKKDRTEVVEEGNETITVKKGYRGVTISKGNEALEVTEGNMSTKVGKGNYAMEVSTGNMETKVGKGNHKLEVSMGNHEIKVAMGNSKLGVSMGDLTQKIDLGSSKTEAMQAIEFKVGQSSVKIDQMGVTIKGMMISIQGQISSEFKGLMTKVSGDAMLQMKGAITMIG